MRRALFGMAVLVAGCTTNEEQPFVAGDSAAGTAATAGAAAAPDTGSATIIGTVRFEGERPPSPSIDMSADPGCLAMYGGGSPTDFQIRASNGLLADVLVYVKSGLPEGYSYPVPGSLPAIDLRECRIRPHIGGARVGQRFEIRNRDTVLHQPRFESEDNPRLAGDLRPGAVIGHTFSEPEMMIPLRCEQHDWMRGNFAVLDHPFFFTTGEEGAFELTGLPPGTYELEAWHTQLGTRRIEVTVPARGTARAEFTFAARS